MAAVTHGVTLATSANAATHTTGSFSPASGDLLVALVEVSTTSTSPGAFTDSLGGTWTLIGTAEGAAAGLRKMWVFARTTASDGSALTGTMDVTGDNGTGAFIEILRVSGMSKFGVTSVLQFVKLDNQTSANTPAISFAVAAQTGNPTVVFLVNLTNPAAVTEPSSWTEVVDTGYASPDTGAQVASRDSGFTGTTITYGGASASNWGLIALELDASASGVTVAPGTGLLTATGFAPTIQLPVIAAAQTGVVNATGFAPAIQVALTVSTQSGVLTATGFAPTIQNPVSVTSGVGAATLTGFAPSVQTPVTVLADVGSAVLAGLAPAISIAVVALPQTGTLTLAGFAPTVLTPVNLLPETGAATLAGFAPSLLLPVSVTPGTGVLVASGFAPTVGAPVTVIGPVVRDLSPSMLVQNASPTVAARDVSPSVLARRKT